MLFQLLTSHQPLELSTRVLLTLKNSNQLGLLWSFPKLHKVTAGRRNPGVWGSHSWTLTCPHTPSTQTVEKPGIKEAPVNPGSCLAPQWECQVRIDMSRNSEAGSHQQPPWTWTSGSRNLCTIHPLRQALTFHFKAQDSILALQMLDSFLRPLPKHIA